MLINSAVQHAIVILKELKDAKEPITSKSIVAKHNVSPTFVDHICRKLREHKYIRSYRGPGGGYVLLVKEVNLMELMLIFTVTETQRQIHAIQPLIVNVKESLANIQVL